MLAYNKIMDNNTQSNHIEDNKKELVEEYLQSLNEKELLACKLAEKLLGMSFQLEKSLGFIQWYEKKYSF